MIDLAPNAIEKAIIEGLERVLAASPTSGATAEDGVWKLDVPVWSRISDLVPIGPDTGDPDLTLLSLALVADRLGAALIALPMLDHIVAARLLARAGVSVAEGRPIALAVELEQLDRNAPALALAGAVAETGVWIGRDGTVRHGAVGHGGDAKHVRTIADLPVAALQPQDWAVLPVAKSVVAQALAERKVLAAAAIGGMTRRAMDLGVDYAKERVQFGAPIGSFQAIAHGLADARVAADTIELLAQEAAWSQTNDPQRFETLSSMAYAHAAVAGAKAVKFAMHVFGGYGNTPEYPIQGYFRSLRALTLAVGDHKKALRAVGRSLLDAPAETPFRIDAPAQPQYAGVA